MSESLFKVRLLSNNLVEVVMGNNVYLDIAVTDAIEQEIDKLLPGGKYYQLVIANGPYVVNPEMRNSMSEGGAGTKMLGLAWISPDEKANREQEEIVSRLPLPMQIRFFSDREKGLTWLQSIAAQ
jgi:hypothetical protein